MRPDIYEKITNQIIAELEKGVRPWMQPWSADHIAGRITRPVRANGVAYRGINTIILCSEAVTKGYAAPIWMTFKMAKELGGYVRKGEQGSLAVYASTIHRTETDEASGEEVERDIHFMKQYSVFNVEQIEGLPEQYTSPAPTICDPVQRIADTESFFAATGSKVSHGGNRAFYSETADRVQMPAFETFKDTESYYATLAHEEIQATKHKDRLARDLGRKRWGDEGYAAEELVAELGSACLCADLKITPEVRDDHAAYISNWIKVFSDDKWAIFTAAAHA